MPNIIQSGDGSQDWEGSDHTNAGYVVVNIEYNASSIDKTVFVAPRAYVVKSVSGRPTVIGSDGGAVTAAIKKAADATAIASGTAVHASTINLKGTANTTQSMVVTAADALIPAGTCLGVDFTGTMTAAVGVITVGLAPA
jgi:hypothetical protein